MLQAVALGFIAAVVGYPQTPLATAEIVKKTSPAVVLIKGSGERGSSLASGFLVSPDGKIATNLHAIRDLKSAGVQLASGDIFDSFTVLAFDERKDLAIIQIAGFDLPVTELGNSNEVQQGEPILVIGSPKGLTGTVTTGVVSAIRDDPAGRGFKLIQTDAAINPGNSGGPLVNSRGQVIGVVVAKLKESENLNFAIPVNYVRGLLNALQKPMSLEETRAKLGTSQDAFQDEPRKKPGVLVAGYGSSGESFQFVFIELLNFLAASGVAVANQASDFRAVRGDHGSLNYLLESLPKLGATALMYATVEHGYSNIHRARLQCFDVKGTLLWEEKASSTWTWAMTEEGAARAVVEQLKKKLKPRLGKPGLPFRQTSPPSPTVKN